MAIRVSVVPTSSDSNTPRVGGGAKPTRYSIFSSTGCQWGRCQVKSQWGAVNLTRPDGTLRQGKSAAVESADAADLDPVADLRAGWHTHVAFGLANAALFGLLHDPERAAISPASGQGLGVLRSRVYRLAAAGRLCVSEQRAVEVNKQSVLRQPVLESSGTHQQRGSDCRPGAGR